MTSILSGDYGCVKKMLYCTAPADKNQNTLIYKKEGCPCGRSLRSDSGIDDRCDQPLRERIVCMTKNPPHHKPCSAILQLTAHIERIAGLPAIIAEDIIFMLRGRDSTHQKVC